ncbi:GIP, partial [Symbiodinium pilosum]
MTKTQLLEEAGRLGALVHHTWSATEIKAVIMEAREAQKEKDPTERMKKISHMTLPELRMKATELSIDYSNSTTKGNLLRLIRDSLNTPDQELMKFGKFRGYQFCEIPKSYGEWVLREMATSESPDPEFVRFGRWSRQKQMANEDDKKMESEIDPKVAAETKLAVLKDKGGDYGEDKNEALTAGPHGEERLLTRKFGGRKCCPELGRDCFFTEEEFVEAYKNRNEICEIDFDGGDEESIEVFECKEFTAEDRIAFAYDSGDFSFATCKEILDESCGDALKSEGDRKRVVQGASGQATFGFYVHGGVSGVTKAVVNHTVLARYLNGFIRAHVGDGATGGAISVIKGGSVKVHHDYNNAAGSRNYFASFGQEAGGELWVHDSSIKEADLQDNKNGEIVWKQAGSGDWLPGRLVDAQEKFVEFDPLVKHQVLDSEVPQELWIPSSHQEERERESGQITNVVGKLSVLFTTLLAAANSFLGECIQTEVINDPIVLLEIGGLDATLDATELNKAVLEPLSWEDYGDSSIKERALYLVKAVTPRQLHLHLRHAPEEAYSDLKELVREQLHGGGAVLLQGGEPRRVVEDVDHYVRYKNNHEGEEWTVLARPGAKNLETPCNLNPHHVLVMSEEEVKIEEKPLRVDGSGITFDKGVPGAQVCEATKEPQVARPTTLPRMLSFGEMVCADILYAHDCEDKRHTFLSLVDVGTTYHVVVKLRNTGGKEIEQAFNTYWLAPFGAPNAISLDLETGLQDGFSRLCSWHNVKIRNSATQAHFQSGVGERQGKWFKNIWIRVCRELSITADEAQLAATSVCCAKNSLRRRCGHSPSAWIFGREARGVEQVLDPDSGGRVTFDISDDARFQRQMAIRASARIAFHKSENDGKLRKALLQRARATTRPFENGEQVHYWNLPKNRRQGRWEGPAIVVGREGNNYWVSRGGRCRLTAPEHLHLRPSGPDETGEFLAMGQVKRELDQLLNQDFDKNDTYASDDEEGNDVEDDIGTLYSPSENHEDGAEVEDIEEDGRSGQDNEPCAVDDEGDEILELLPDQDDETGRDREPTKRGWPTSRMKHKTPPEDVEWKENDTFMAYSAMLMRKHLTKRGLEKRQEKELRWDEIPEQFQQKFRDAECKQWSEHLHYDALEPLNDAETEYVKKHVAGERVLRSRWAYKDKNWSRRRLEGQAEWRCKSRLVIA